MIHAGLSLATFGAGLVAHPLTQGIRECGDGRIRPDKCGWQRDTEGCFEPVAQFQSHQRVQPERFHRLVVVKRFDRATNPLDLVCDR